MKVECNIVLTLSEHEGAVLKSVLGSMNDNQFSQICGVSGIDRMLMSELYDSIPDCNEENND